MSVVVVLVVLVGAIGCAAALAAVATVVPGAPLLVASLVAHGDGVGSADAGHDDRAALAALHRAVAGTLAARSAHIVGHVSSRRSGVVAEVRGTTSFVDPLGSFTITTATTPAPTEIRIRGDTAWVKTADDDHWHTMPAAAAGYLPGRPSGLGGVGHPSWPDLFRSLLARPDTVRWLSPARPLRLSTVVDGRDATVDLDRTGRIRALHLDRGAGVTLHLKISDLGTEVTVVPP